MAGLLVSFLVGFAFAIGLGISGMTQPQKVIGFLDLFGRWDPSLAFVMVGAIGVHAMAYFWIKRRTSPILADQFHIPNKKEMPTSLFVGAMLFGAGWGLGGFCPGPGLTSLASGAIDSFIFVGAMLAGMALFRLTKPFIDRAS